MNNRNQKTYLIGTGIIVFVLVAVFIAARNTSTATADINSHQEINESITAFPIQLERDKYGMAMIDKSNETIWIYEISSRGPTHKILKLLAARSFKYDKFLTQYNTADPNPDQVKKLLESLAGPPENQPQQEQPRSGSSIESGRNSVNLTESDNVGLADK